MVGETLMVGVTLLGVIPFVVWDAVSSLRAGFDSAFWALPLDAKLGRIPDRRGAWQGLGIVWIFINVLLAAGFTAFTVQLAGAGEPVWAALGLGAFLVGAIAFPIGVLFMVTTIAEASAEHGEGVPGWAQAVWRSSWWLERTFVITANLAYVAWGIGMVSSGFPATWAGWVAIATGALIAAWASLREYFFQHMVLVTPIVLGVALLLH